MTSRALALFLLWGAGMAAPPSHGQSEPTLMTNESFVQGLAAPVDLQDPRAVFGAVFAALDDEITVHPTENYYYFRLWAAGKEVWGSLALPARTRDKGVLSFGYRARNAAAVHDSQTVGGGALLTARDGLHVRAIADHVYDVEFEGRSVRFRLNPTELASPHEVPLAAGERYVGPVLDESGLAFHLLFDEKESHLFLVLDEREAVSETFHASGTDLIFGERTAFALWVEESLHRKILIGVAREHVLSNDWYDGPFDQMPDNAIAMGRIPDYRGLVEASYPAARGRIDRFGYYLDEEGTRVAVAPYLVYSDGDEVQGRARSCRDRTSSIEAFRACITSPAFHHWTAANRSGGAR